MRNVYILIGGLFTIGYVLSKHSKSMVELRAYRAKLDKDRRWWQGPMRQKLVDEEMMVDNVNAT